MKAFDLLDFPLKGLSLIEASAGTGKTYAVANLYLRQLMEARLEVEQILVVTFTEAATQELRDRIRKRIQDLRRVFEGKAQSANDRALDPVLQRLFENSSEPESDLLRLRMAERQMDQAEIYTIHGFCQRLLQDYAMPMGVALERALEEDMAPFWLQACQDFWRREVLKLPQGALRFVREFLADPEDLQQKIRPMILRQPRCLIPAPDPEGIAGWLQTFASALSWFDTLKQQTRDAMATVKEVVAGSDLKNVNRKLEWLDAIAQWAETDSLSLPRRGKTMALDDFLPATLAGQLKKNAEMPGHPWFGFIDHWLQEQPDALAEGFLVAAYTGVCEALQRLKHDKKIMGFDDLILDVAHTLGMHSGAQPEHLIKLIRQQYATAMIDEFQDTDAAQYHIFSALFAGHAVGSDKGTSIGQESALCLIGDPKQAIYSFRGGDIATYLRAKRDVQAAPDGECFSMDTNWRSLITMVDAVNAVFSWVPGPFGSEQIPFMPVQSGFTPPEEGPSSAQWGPALRLIQAQTDGLAKAGIDEQLASFCVAEITRLVHPDNPLKLRNADIAILVRSASEAELIRSVLGMNGLRASFELRSSIFESEEALWVLALMEAVAEPESRHARMVCLSQVLTALPDSHLSALQHSHQEAAVWVARFESLQQTWQQAGILSMLRHALSELALVERWSQSVLANESSVLERRLSNLNQLAELLQHQARRLKGHHSLIRWFQDRLAGKDSLSDENRLRLESDEQLIQIVTIHKSKGLEYPVVFLPFVHSTKASAEAWFYDTNGDSTLDLLRDDNSLQAAEQERLAEDMRLLYVALTRAKYRCYLGCSAYKNNRSQSLGLRHTAWGRLLAAGQGDIEDDARLSEALQAKADAHPQIEYTDLSRQTEAMLPVPARDKPDALQSGEFDARCLHYDWPAHWFDWKVQSFTALLNESGAHQSAQTEAAGLELFSGKTLSRADANAGISIFRFPKGSRAGTFLHTLFEAIALDSGCLVEALRLAYDSLEHYIRDSLAASGLIDARQIDSWSGFLVSWLEALRQQDLHPNVRLSKLQSGAYVPEMTFHFSVAGLDANALNHVLAQHRPGLPALEIQRFEGHLQGAIDLVFKQDEQFYILDYKSNYLGEELSDYQPEALAEAMDEHRYDLQYLLYTLALHRHLKQRLGEQYSYERNFGGVLYVFLRGLPLEELKQQDQKQNDVSKTTPINKTGVYYAKPALEVIEALDQVFSAPALSPATTTGAGDNTENADGQARKTGGEA